jgi:hypothetical protein
VSASAAGTRLSEVRATTAAVWTCTTDPFDRPTESLSIRPDCRRHAKMPGELLCGMRGGGRNRVTAIAERIDDLDESLLTASLLAEGPPLVLVHGRGASASGHRAVTNLGRRPAWARRGDRRAGRSGR